MTCADSSRLNELNRLLVRDLSYYVAKKYSLVVYDSDEEGWLAEPFPSCLTCGHWWTTSDESRQGALVLGGSHGPTDRMVCIAGCDELGLCASGSQTVLFVGPDITGRRLHDPRRRRQPVVTWSLTLLPLEQPSERPPREADLAGRPVHVIRAGIRRKADGC